MDEANNSSPPDWERVAQSFTNALDGQRAGYWAAADLVHAVLDGLTPEMRTERIRDLARVAHSSVSFITKLADLAAVFPVPYRYPDVSQAFYIAVLAASKRTGEKPHLLLDKALRLNWHVQKLNNIGQNYNKRRVRVSGKCMACGGFLLFTRTGDRGGLMIPCPGCLGEARYERRSLLDAFVPIGQLR